LDLIWPGTLAVPKDTGTTYENWVKRISIRRRWLKCCICWRNRLAHGTLLCERGADQLADLRLMREIAVRLKHELRVPRLEAKLQMRLEASADMPHNVNSFS